MMITLSALPRPVRKAGLALLLLLISGAAFCTGAPPHFDKSLLTTDQDFIQVKGNRFYDEQGKVFVFRGVSTADPDKLEKEGQWNPELFKTIRDWGANTVRLPIHPRAWRSRGVENYLALVDQAVVWANRHGLYLIIDWHSIGYLETGKYQREGYVTNKEETFDFWRRIAWRYQGIPTTAVYELFNEPTTLEQPWGKPEWLAWKERNEQMIDIIYAVDKKVIPLVAGFNWAYDLRFVRDFPVARKGIAYVSHPYPQKVTPADKTDAGYFREWDKDFGYVGQTYPMILTELGWVRPDGYGAHQPVLDDGSYGPRIVEYMETRGLSWMAWVFDPRWSPTLINDWDFTPSEQGAFFRKTLLELN